MSKKLTSKQALFAKHYASGKSGKQAAVLAGYSEKSAEVIASENLRKPKVLRKIEAVLDKAGLSDEALAQRLQQAIDAGLGEKAKNADSLKGIKMALELKDRFPSKKHEVTQESKFEMKLQTMTSEQLENYLEKISKDTQVYLEKIKNRRLGRKKRLNGGQKVGDVIQQGDQPTPVDIEEKESNKDGGVGVATGKPAPPGLIERFSPG